MLAEIHTFRLCEFHLYVLKREEKWFQVKHQWASKTGQQPCKQTRMGSGPMCGIAPRGELSPPESPEGQLGKWGPGILRPSVTTPPPSSAPR